MTNEPAGSELFKKLSFEKFYEHFGYDLTKQETNIACPFHDDRTPSLSINRTTGLFHCHACTAHGDAIGFYMQLKKVGFKQAVREIGEIFGVKLKGEKKKPKDWKVQRLRLGDINLDSEAIKTYFEGKNIVDPQKIINQYGLKWCEHNEAIAIPVGKRWKLKAIDERGDRWDIDSEEIISPLFLELSPYKGQKNLVLIEGISNLFSLASYADDDFEFSSKYYVICSVHGVNATLKLAPIVNFGAFDNVFTVLDNDEAGQLEAGNILEAYPDASNVALDEIDLRDWLKDNSLQDLDRVLINTKSVNSKIKERLEFIRKSPDKLKLAIQDVQKLGIVGEEVNIGITFLCMLSHKFDNCVGAVLKGRYSSGKTAIVTNVAKLFPPERVQSLTGVSTMGLQYMFDLSHKIIIQTEEPPANDPKYWEINSQFRQLITEKKITRAIPEKDPKTNKFKTTIYEVNGPITYISTTTQPGINPENESRLVSLQTDDTNTHIIAVKDMLNRQAKRIWISEEEEEVTTKSWQRFIRELPFFKTRNVGINFADQLDMRSYGSEMIRDYDKMLKLIRIVTYLNHPWNVTDYEVATATDSELPEIDTSQENVGITPKLPSDRGGPKDRDTKIIFSTKEDYKCVYELTKEFFNSKATKISQDTKRNFERIKSAFRTLTFTRKRVQDTLNIAKTKAQELIYLWLEEQMITQQEENGPKGAYQYKVNEGWEVIDADLVLPDSISTEENISISPSPQVSRSLANLAPIPAQTAEVSISDTCQSVAVASLQSLINSKEVEPVVCTEVKELEEPKKSKLVSPFPEDMLNAMRKNIKKEDK